MHSPVPVEPPRSDTVAWDSWRKHHDDNIQAQCIMLAGMNPTFRRQNKGYTAYQIMARLQDLHASSVRSERYDVSRRLFGSRMQEGTSVEKHISDMIACIDRLAALNFLMDAELYIDLVLQSLPPSWSSFVLNYNMLHKELTLGELMSMAKDAEPEINKGRKREAHIAESSQKGKKKKGKKKKTFSSGPTGGVKKV